VRAFGESLKGKRLTNCLLVEAADDYRGCHCASGAARNAQSTAYQAATAAGAAQSFAHQVQNSADQASLLDGAAGVVGLADAAAIAAVD
jgi:hypothetical protein